MANTRNHYTLFADASFDPRTKSGIAGWLIVPGDPTSLPGTHPAAGIKLKLVKDTTCARLELEAVLAALESIKAGAPSASVTVYTDSKTIVELPARRQRLVSAGFRSKTTGKALNNGDLYIHFFKLIDLFQPKIIWLQGHKPSQQRTVIEGIFAQVDQLTRQALRASRANQD